MSKKKEKGGTSKTVRPNASRTKPPVEESSESLSAHKDSQVEADFTPGITRFAWVEVGDLDQFADNEDNWRLHGEHQQEAFNELFSKVGWAGVLLYNEVTGRLVDGHMRKALSKKGLTKKSRVPIAFGNWTPEQEAILLAQLDPLAAMAGTNATKLKALTDKTKKKLEQIREQTGHTAPVMAEVNEQLARLAEKVNRGGEGILFSQKEVPEVESLDNTDSDIPGMMELKDEFDYDVNENPYGIPSLRLDKFGLIPEPIATWSGPHSSPNSEYYFYPTGGGSAKGMPWNRSVLGFYAEDHIFENCWIDPSGYAGKIINRNPYAVITPDFSTSSTWPMAQNLYNIYRNRWVARYYQEIGLPIIPNISIPVDPRADDYFFIGLPAKLPWIAFQIQTSFKDTEMDYQLAYADAVKRIINILKPQAVFVYGSNAARPKVLEMAKLPKNLHVVQCETRTDQRRHIMDQKKDDNDGAL